MLEPVAQQQSHVTSEQLVRVASRLVVAYLLFSVVAELVALPHETATVIRYAREGSNGSYYFHLWKMYLDEGLFRIVLWLIAARWFYRCGPRITSFFTDVPKPMAWLDTSLKEIVAKRNEPPSIKIDRD